MHRLTRQSELLEGQPDPVGLSSWVDVVRWGGDDGWVQSRPTGRQRYGIDGREVSREEYEQEAARRAG